jgi:hypothetical protein
VLDTLGVVILQKEAFKANLALLVVFSCKFEAVGDPFLGVQRRRRFDEAPPSVRGESVAVNALVAEVVVVEVLAVVDRIFEFASWNIVDFELKFVDSGQNSSTYIEEVVSPKADLFEEVLLHLVVR